MARNKTKSGPPPTRDCPCKHPAHNGARCGNQIGVDQDVCVECKAHADEVGSARLTKAAPLR